MKTRLPSPRALADRTVVELDRSEDSSDGSDSTSTQLNGVQTLLVVGPDPERWLRGLSIGAAALVLLHLVIQIVHHRLTAFPRLVRDVLHLDVEQALGTWYAAMLLGLASVVAFACARQDAADRTRRRAWMWLGGGMLCMSVDEVAGIHEAINTAIGGGWAMPAGILSLLIVGAFLPFFATLEIQTRTRLLYSGLTFLGGALVVEMATSHVTTDTKSLAYALSVALEEGLELTGVLLFLRAALGHLDGWGGVRDPKCEF